MDVQQIDKMLAVAPSPASGEQGNCGLLSINPASTIAGAGPRSLPQPGMIPISLGHVLTMAGMSAVQSDPIHDLLKEQLLRFVALQENHIRGRKTILGQSVYDLWGLLNPENYFVLAILAMQLAKNSHGNKAPLQALFIGTGSGYPEVCLVDLCNELEFGIHITTVDFRSDDSCKRNQSSTLVPHDERNLEYGPVPEDGIAFAINQAQMSNRAKSYQGKIQVVHADSHSYLPSLPSETFDLIVVDGNHLFDGVYLDMLLSWPHLRDGGLLFLDDFGGSKMATNGGVTMAAYHFAARTRQIGYYVSSPQDPVQTNVAFFIRSFGTKTPELPTSIWLEVLEAEKRLGIRSA